MIIYNPELHEYSENGTIIKSVTQILKEAGYINDRYFTVESAEKGTAVHELAQRYAKGMRADLSGRLLASLEYVNAFSCWFRDKRVYAIATEQTISGELNGHRYAGRFDLLAEIDGKRWLVDYKTGAGQGWHKAQIAAYALGKIEGVPGSREPIPVNPYGCMMLYLKSDGTYRTTTVTGAALLDGLSQFKDAISKDISC